MTAEQWQTVWAIYETVEGLPSAERRAAAESASADPEVVQEVLSMLEDAQEPPESQTRFPHPGDRIGRYEVAELLGRGGMGAVYAARDTELGRPVALKFLLQPAIVGQGAIKRFVREAQAASALNHPNILTVHEVIHSASGLAIAMEMVEGTALSEFRGSPLPVPELGEMMRQAATALSAAHDKGIVHRDIKPENLMVRPDGFVKVLDFGLARDLGKVNATQSSTVGLAAGTLRYMSPEQLRGEQVTGASDVYSLGVVFYELAAGRHPFESAHALETVFAMHLQEPAHLSKVNRRTPASLDKLLASMLHRDPTLRPSARQVAAVLASNANRPSGGRSAAWWGGAAAAVAMVLTAIAVPLSMRPKGPGPDAGGSTTSQTPLRIVPLTSFPGYKRDPAFSPDGGQFAFSWNGAKRIVEGGPDHIYIQVIGAGDPLRLTSAAADDRMPAWSPDGRAIAFSRMSRGDYSTIYVIPALGGTERRITEAGSGVSWTADSKRLVIAGRSTAGGIVLWSLETGEHRDLTAPVPPAFDIDPAVSPDGHWVAFIRSFSPASKDVFVIPIDGGRATQLSFDHRPVTRAAWTPDSRELVYSSNQGGGDYLWRIPRTGGPPRRLPMSIWNAENVAISLRGDRLAYRQRFRDFNIYAYQGRGFTHGSEPDHMGRPAGLIVSSREDHSPSISPNGERIAFVSTRSGDEEIWVCGRKGDHTVQLTSFKGRNVGTPRWSADGNWIAFDSRLGSTIDLYVIAADGGSLRPLNIVSYNPRKPAWAPDGNWIYFVSDRSGKDQVWKIPVTGGPAMQVTIGGGFEGLPSPDGKVVYFIKRDRDGVWSVPAQGGSEAPVYGWDSGVRIGRDWGVLREGIYFVSVESLNRIRFFSLAAQRETELATLDKPVVGDYPGISLSADGRLLVVTHVDQELDDLMLAEDFR